MIPAIAQRAYRDYPEEFKNPLALFGRDTRHLLQQYSYLQSTSEMIFVEFKEGRALLRRAEKGVDPIPLRRLYDVLKQFRDKVRHHEPEQKFSGVLGLYIKRLSIDELGIDQTRFKLGRYNFIVTPDGVVIGQ